MVYSMFPGRRPSEAISPTDTSHNTSRSPSTYSCDSHDGTSEPAQNLPPTTAANFGGSPTSNYTAANTVYPQTNTYGSNGTMPSLGDSYVSTLEVHAGGDLEVVRASMFPSKAHEAAAIAKGWGQHNPSPVEGPPAPAYTPWQSIGAHSQQSIVYHNEKAGMGPMFVPDRHCVGGGNEGRICGLPRTLFIAAAVGVGVFLLGMVGTIIGVVIIKQRASAAAAEAAAAARAQFSSKIAATNWTDTTSGLARSAVFYQDHSGSIMMQHIDDIGKRWSSINVTASVMNSTNSAGLDVKKGTPLAVATNNFQMSVYYLSADNRVSEIWMLTDADRFGVWNMGVLASTIDTRAAPNTRIAAHWQLCAVCPGALLVLYQGLDGVVQTANMSGGSGNWDTSIQLVKTPSATGTGLCISQFVDDAGVPRTGQDPNALRVYRVVGRGLFESMYGPLGGFRWTAGNFGAAINSGLPTPAPELASLTYSVNAGWDHNLVTSLDSTGALMSHVWDGRGRRVQAPKFNGTPSTSSTKFSTFTTTQDMKMYGIVDGEIVQYSVAAKTDPFSWSYVGKVTEGNILGH